MRIHMTENRERLYDGLVEASSENTKSKAIDEAARFYLRMKGGEPVEPSSGVLSHLMGAAITEGGLTPEQIEAIANTPEVPIHYEHEWSVGNKTE